MTLAPARADALAQLLPNGAQLGWLFIPEQRAVEV